MSTLYELTNDYQALMALLNSDEELTEEHKALLAEAYDQIEGDFHQKAEGTVKIINDLKGSLGKIECEIERLNARKKHFKNRIEFLTAGLKGAMESTGIDKIRSSLFNISLSKPRAGAVVLDIDPSELPPEYQTVKIEANKTLIKEDLKQGVYIEGCHLAETRTLSMR